MKTFGDFDRRPNLDEFFVAAAAVVKGQTKRNACLLTCCPSRKDVNNENQLKKKRKRTKN